VTVRNGVRKTITPVRVIAVRPDHHLEVPDRLATEEPMEIRAAGPGHPVQQVTVTMRTPGHDFELATGFLLTEGLIGGPADVAAVKYCDAPPGEEQQFNIVTVELARPYRPDGWSRAFGVNSSCGVCGKVALDQIESRCPPVTSSLVVPASLIPTLARRLGEAQRVFAQTGGLHAAALFRPDGELEALREDVGRHNAVDKIVGHVLLQHRLPLDRGVLMVSGRLSFEIVQKAAVAGVPIVAAVSAPSSLAVDAAGRLGVTLAGFVRGGTFNLYTRPERIELGG
jgi:FdhD protein